MKLGRLDATIDGAHLTLAGRIDDSCQLGELAARLAPGPVTIDTGGVTFVNSIGMREWMRLVRALRDRGPVTLVRVADVLMTQMNMIPELAASVRVLSFHAHYACPKCGAEAALLIDAVAHAAELAQLRAPQLPCAECGAAMELGDFPERYLMMFRGK